MLSDHQQDFPHAVGAEEGPYAFNHQQQGQGHQQIMPHQRIPHKKTGDHPGPEHAAHLDRRSFSQSKHLLSIGTAH